MNSKEIIEQRALYPVDFHDSFFDAFGKNIREMDAAPMSHDFTLGKIDATYLGKMLLNGDEAAWMDLANRMPALDADAEHLQDLYADLCAYVDNPDFTADDLRHSVKEEFAGIADYFAEKFPKTAFTQEKTHRQTHEILAAHQ